MPVSHIDTLDDDRLAAFRNVPDAELLARLGLFVAEGRLVVRRLLANNRLETCAVMVTPAALASLEAALAEHPVPVYLVPQEVMNGVGGFNFHRGCLALGRRPAPNDWRALAARASRVVALERVANADNVGAVFRNAAGFGVDAVLLHEDCADPLYRKAIRTSMAATLSIPFAIAPWPAVLRHLDEIGWATVAMTPAREAPLLRDVAAEIAGRRTAIVVGHEGEGLTRDALAACTHRARIAMAEGVDSLNVATAAAIALHEISFQHRSAPEFD